MEDLNKEVLLHWYLNNICSYTVQTICVLDVLFNLYSHLSKIHWDCQ